MFIYSFVADVDTFIDLYKLNYSNIEDKKNPKAKLYLEFKL